MKREDFERLKAEEKAHLREIQKLKRRLREVERVRSIGKALSDVEAAGSMDQLDEALTKVKLEVLEGEAKLDVAIDSSLGGAAAQSDPAEMEADLSKARAAELVRHMKISMGLEERDSGRSGSSGPSLIPEADSSGGKSVGRAPREGSDSGSDGNDASETDPIAQKTIGRMGTMNRGDE